MFNMPGMFNMLYIYRSRRGRYRLYIHTLGETPAVYGYGYVYVYMYVYT